MSLLNLKEKPSVAKPRETLQKPVFKFELPKTLDKKINATDKSSAVTLTKFSRKPSPLKLFATKKF